MTWDETEPRKPSSQIAIGEDLKILSVAELEDRVGRLTSEIERINAEIALKRKHNAAASALFRT